MLSVFQHYTIETGNPLSSPGVGMYKVLSRTLPLSAAFILMIDIIFKVKKWVSVYERSRETAEVESAGE